MNLKTGKHIIFAPFEDKYLEQVIELNKINLWPRMSEQFEKKFKHDTLNNPAQRDLPSGVVALFGNKVIGYKGMIGSAWKVNNFELNIITPSNTSVHIDYRRMGVFENMTKMAFEIYQNSFQYFLNTSSNKYSSPGNLKLNWYELGEKEYLIKFNNPLTIKKNVFKDKLIIVDSAPIVAICQINYSSCFKADKIKLSIYSEEYANWLFNYPSYKFCVLNIGSQPIAFCCFEIFDKKCQIIHYDSMIDDKKIFFNMLKLISEKFDFYVFRNYTAKNKTSLHETFCNSGFYPTNIRWLRRLLKWEIAPFLIKPVESDLVSDSNLYDNVNVYDINNWIFSPINNY
jgi:hypothetical protein